MRSPVEAGSSEYSAVIQPVPRPAIQRGTPSSTVAVQSTLVFPCCAEHGAVRLLEEVGRELERPKLVGTAARPPGSCGGSLEVGERDLLDLVDRELQEASAHRAETARDRRWSGTGTRPRAPASFSIPLRASVSATSRAVSSAEKTSVTPRPKTRWKIGRISG